MKLPRLLVSVGVALLLLAPVVRAWPVAAQSELDGLGLQQLNISGDEFVRLTNFGDADLNMSGFWLGYDSDGMAAAPPEQQLPNGILGHGNSIILSREPMANCGADYSGDLDFSLSNGDGVLSLWKLDSSSEPSVFNLVWRLRWGAESAGGNTLPTSTYNLNVDKEDVVEDYMEDKGIVPELPVVWHFARQAEQLDLGWHVGYKKECAFTAVSTVEDSSDDGYAWQQANDGPPFALASVVYEGSSRARHGIPSSDIGLKAVQISEILPNPASPDTDAKNEFVELYNPNDKIFDLSDFIIQTASTSSGSNHTYRIPADTTLKPHGFMAFTSGKTTISLTNSGGQVWLLDPLGKTMANSPPYDKADDGMAWLNAGGNWQWTARPTPNSSNKLAEVAGAGSSSSKTAKIDDKEVTQIASESTENKKELAAPDTTEVKSDLSVHPLTLAIVVIGAVIYGAYEYRHDLANRYRQFRRQRAARR